MAFDLEESLKRALGRAKGDTEVAAALFIRWCEQDSQIADLLQPIVKEAIEARLSKISRTEPLSE